jgi:ubiquinone/menaquinone biosynthesis C-methylase UbiE
VVTEQNQEQEQMHERDTLELNRRGWNTISESYQRERRISTDDVHYGPMAPGERELRLLGDVRRKRVLEVGCGGGQNAVVMAKWGAICTGVDPSDAQLAHARKLARDQGVEVEFVNGIAEDLSAFAAESFDLVLSSFAFDYVADLRQAYSEVWRVLKPGGPFVFCQSHPWFQATGWILAGDPEAQEIGNYAAWPIAEDWEWAFESGATAAFRDHQRPLAQILNQLIEAGFTLERMVEQHYEDVANASPEELERLPYTYLSVPESREYEVMRKLPFTLLLKARKQSA